MNSDHSFTFLVDFDWEYSRSASGYQINPIFCFRVCISDLGFCPILVAVLRLDRICHSLIELSNCVTTCRRMNAFVTRYGYL